MTPEATPMFLISKRPTHDDFLDNPPFPLAGAAAGLIAVLNVTSTVMMLISL